MGNPDCELKSSLRDRVDVNLVLINLQVGWKASAQSNDLETARMAASTTGLKRYLDARSSLLDARRSAVRDLLDEALALIAPAPGTAAAAS